MIFSASEIKMILYALLNNPLFWTIFPFSVIVKEYKKFLGLDQNLKLSQSILNDPLKNRAQMAITQDQTSEN